MVICDRVCDGVCKICGVCVWEGCVAVCSGGG